MYTIINSEGKIKRPMVKEQGPWSVQTLFSDLVARLISVISQSELGWFSRFN
jgi:hypothetical protein